MIIRYFICLIYSFTITSVTVAQTVPIPDPNFVNWLNSNGFASCLTGNQLDTACIPVVNAITLNCKNSGISNLDGIQYFDSLDTLICYSNPLINLPVLPSSLRLLSCYSCSLQSLPSLPDFLTNLDCKSNQLSVLPNLPDSLKVLDCSNNQIVSLPAFNNLLYTLNCSSNLLTSLPVLPDSLKYFDCSSNQLDSIPLIPVGLLTLYCSFNSITSLPGLPYYTLQKLVCDHNQLTNIQYPLPKYLTHLICDYNQLSSLPFLGYNSILNTIYCSNNLLTSFPSLQFSNAYTVNISHNLLTSIPNPLHDFYYFNCSYNLLTTLPYVHILSTGQLICDHNQLTSLGFPSFWSNGNIQLSCNDNQLTSLPPLKNSINRLNCSNNNLTSLPDLPATMSLLLVNNNPNLICLPKLTTINQLQFQNTGVQCIPNYGSVSLSLPALASLPICDIFNNNGCDFYWNINGSVFIDSNSNCVNESTEVKASNVKLNLFKNGILQQQVFTGGEGLYSFDTDTGTFIYSIDTIDLPVTVNCPTSGFQTSVISLLDSLDYNVDFGMQCKPGFDVGISSVVCDSGFFRPGSLARVAFIGGDMSNFFGLHCANGVGGNVKIAYTGPINYVGPAIGSLTPNILGDTLIFTFADFGILNFQQAFKSVFITDTLAQNGQQICFTIFVEPLSGDFNTVNNYFQECYSVTSSFDPNFKIVFPADSILNTQEWLTYTIHFQNTGTSPAQHIYILDTLDVNLDESSVALLSSSHSVMAQATDKVLKFNFPNIELPDSGFNEPLSHGFVKYKIKLKDSLALGTLIQNTANIIFDFNQPIVTNTVPNIITDCSQLTIADFILPDTICRSSILTVTAEIAFSTELSWYVDSVYAGSGLTFTIKNLNAGSHNIQLVATYGNCSQTIQHFIYLKEPNQPILTVSGDTIFSSPALMYQWLYNNNIIPGATQSFFVTNAPGLFTVLITDSEGCSVKSTSIVGGCNHAANVSISTNSICQNDSILLIVNPFSNVTWTWILDSVNISTAATFFLGSLAPGYHTLDLFAAHPLCPLSLLFTQNITVWQLPAQPIITIFSDTLVSSVQFGNQWFFNGSNLSGAIEDSLVVQQSGWYYVMITDSNGCNVISDSTYINLVSLNEITNTNFSVLPNPFDDILLISLSTSSMRIVISDITGKLIFDNSFTKNFISIPTSEWNEGVYILQLITPQYQYFKKIIKN